MFDKIGQNLAAKILIGISAALIVFHTANLFGLIPMNITWLGKIEADRTMLIMGAVSILLNAAFVLCAAVELKWVRSPLLASVVEKILPFLFWWLVGNTIANLFSETVFEVVVFTPVLVVLTVCIYRLKNQTRAPANA